MMAIALIRGIGGSRLFDVYPHAPTGAMKPEDVIGGNVIGPLYNQLIDKLRPRQHSHPWHLDPGGACGRIRPRALMAAGRTRRWAEPARAWTWLVLTLAVYIACVCAPSRAAAPAGLRGQQLARMFAASTPPEERQHLFKLERAAALGGR